MVNQFLLNRMLKTSNTVPSLRCYATSDSENRFANLFLMNKDLVSRQVTIQLRNDEKQDREFQRVMLKGNAPDDRAQAYTQLPNIAASGASIDIVLPPLSLTVLSQAGQ